MLTRWNSRIEHLRIWVSNKWKLRFNCNKWNAFHSVDRQVHKFKRKQHLRCQIQISNWTMKGARRDNSQNSREIIMIYHQEMCLQLTSHSDMGKVKRKTKMARLILAVCRNWQQIMLKKFKKMILEVRKNFQVK
jgi:hypothetical protein